jgi:hypothetical protein
MLLLNLLILFIKYIYLFRRKKDNFLMTKVLNMLKLYFYAQVSFVEVDGTRVALTAAHELAHGLGAFHDGEEDTADCPASAQNIMSPEITLTTNLTYSRAQWSFSACSVASFKSYIDG